MVPNTLQTTSETTCNLWKQAVTELGSPGGKFGTFEGVSQQVHVFLKTFSELWSQIKIS